MKEEDVRMEWTSVLVAAAGAYAFGAIWYGINGKAWMAAAGIEPGPEGTPEGGMTPYAISAIGTILAAGMMLHMFTLSGIDTLPEGALSGFGLGAFIAAPWIITNYSYASRPRALMVIDGGYAIIGCTIIGAILTLF